MLYNKLQVKKSIAYLIVVLSILILIARFGSQPLSQLLGYQDKAGIKITSTPDAMVSVNGASVGKTPYQNESLKPGNYTLRLEENGAFWEGMASLTSGTLSIVNRELSPSVASSSGEILTLEPGVGAVIVSNPAEAVVEIDGQSYGKTPLSVSSIPPGDHTFVLSHDNYLKRSIRVVLPQGMSLHIAVDLAVYEADLGTSLPAPAVSTSNKLVVGKTPTGFLRVRNKPSVLGVEVGRLSTGDTVVEIEDTSGWVKIRMDNGTEGYVSSQYVQKQL